MLRVNALLLLSTVLACGGGHPAANTTTAHHDDGSFVVEGIAGNAKAGAIIEPAGGGVVYIAGLREWPATLVGTHLRAAGKLDVVHHEDPCPTPEHCAAGLSGTQRILRDASVTDAAGNAVLRDR
jgi:hypothetical protein